MGRLGTRRNPPCISLLNSHKNPPHFFNLSQFYSKSPQTGNNPDILQWVNVKQNLQEKRTPNTYYEIFHAFRESDACLDADYENLLVYFTFRYFMNAYYNMDVLSYAKLAVVFTLMIRDMDMVRFEENGGAFSRADRVDTARIFSKEVEHSEENVEYVREEILFL